MALYSLPLKVLPLHWIISSWILEKNSRLFITSDLNVNDYIANVSSTFCFKEISQSLVRNQLQNLKANKATGLDKVSIHVLKDSVEAVIPSVTSLFNKSLFPSIWKNAKVTAIFKTGKQSDLLNYCPSWVKYWRRQFINNYMNTWCRTRF